MGRPDRLLPVFPQTTCCSGHTDVQGHSVAPRHSVSLLDEHGVGEEEAAAGGRSRQTHHWASEQLSLREQFEQRVLRRDTQVPQPPHTQRLAGGRERICHRTTRQKLARGAEEPQRGSCTRIVCPGSRLRLKDKAVALGIGLPEERRRSAPQASRRGT